jgi:hypothetical protein
LENRTYYTQRIEACKIEHAKAKRSYQLIGTFRLVSFLLAFSSLYFFWGSSISFIGFGVFFISFLILVNLSVNAKYQRDKWKKLIEINEEEINVLNGYWLHFEEGNEFKNAQHAYALDMDLFGKKSIYQLFNRTVSRKGSNLLAHQLMYGTENQALANEAIETFSKEQDWCQEFLSEGLVFDKTELDRSFEKITSIESREMKEAFLMRFAVPILSIAATVLVSFELISGTVFSFYIVFILGLIGKNFSKVNVITSQVTSYASQVKMQQRQLALYKKLQLNPGLLSKSQEALFNDDQNLVQSLKKLEKIQNRMDFRMNLLVGTVLNFYLAWDYHVIHQWNQWKNENQNNLGKWEKQLAQLEVWISGAVYRFNFPETCYAKFSEQDAIKITKLGHPFVQSQKRVSNNVEMNEENHFLIITGPNMAGKSTYLRSLGLAFICANAGFPILAKSCEIPQMSLYSSMRTTDDLTVESSYFHAELTRLRFIMDAIERGEKVFIILDEILKGTNSKDKEIGSAKFLEKLQSLNAKGVIATHDLSLCNLATNNIAYKNWYFDSTIENNELSFDYKIREGVCQNMNASFLLKKMKLVD